MASGSRTRSSAALRAVLLVAAALALAAADLLLQPGARAVEAASTASVGIQDNCGGYSHCFTPPSVSVDAGGTVTWTSSSTAPHTVTGDSWGSGDLAFGQSYQHTFSAAGTYHYVCSIHSYMSGTVVVGNGVATTTSSQSSQSTHATSSSTARTTTTHTTTSSSTTTTTTAPPVTSSTTSAPPPSAAAPVAEASPTPEQTSTDSGAGAVAGVQASGGSSGGGHGGLILGLVIGVLALGGAVGLLRLRSGAAPPA